MHDLIVLLLTTADPEMIMGHPIPERVTALPATTPRILGGIENLVTEPKNTSEWSNGPIDA